MSVTAKAASAIRIRILALRFSNGRSIDVKTSNIDSTSIAARFFLIGSILTLCGKQRPQRQSRVPTVNFRLVTLGLPIRSLNRQGQLIGQQRRHGIAYLRELLQFITAKLIPIRKTLQPCRFTLYDSPTPSIRQTDTLHIARRTRQITTGDCPRRKIRIEVTRPAAVRFTLVFSNITILRRRQEMAPLQRDAHRVSNRLANSNMADGLLRKRELGAMTNRNNSLAILGNAIINRIQAAKLDNVTTSPQFIQNKIKIPLMGMQQVPNILKQEDFRAQSFHRINKNRETVASILHPSLLSSHTERLAGRTTNQNVSIRIIKTDLKFFPMTDSLQILVIGVRRGRDHLVPNCFKSRGFKAKRKSATTGKQVNHLRRFRNTGDKRLVDMSDIGHDTPAEESIRSFFRK